MLSGPTVLVLGAGSSCDFKLPIGTGLAADIVTRLSTGKSQVMGDLEFWEQLHYRVKGERKRYEEAAYRLARSVQRLEFIDEALFTHARDEAVVTVGKLAMVKRFRLWKQRASPTSYGGTTTR